MVNQSIDLKSLLCDMTLADLLSLCLYGVSVIDKWSVLGHYSAFEAILGNFDMKYAQGAIDKKSVVYILWFMLYQKSLLTVIH